jgi:hypothetical protein
MKRAYDLFALIIILAFFGTLLSGFVICPYAPYHEEGGKSVDKLGREVSAEDYRIFEMWQGVLFVLVIPFASLAIGNAVWHYRRTGSLRISAKAKGDVQDF